MNKFAECFCGQLTIEVTAEPEIQDSNNQYKFEQVRNHCSDNFAYFKNDQVIGTKGESFCRTVHAQEEGISRNRYHCPMCDTALFCVDSNQPSLVGIAENKFINEPSAIDPLSSSISSASLTKPDADYTPKYMAPVQD